MVGSDLEDKYYAGTDDLFELLDGYFRLPDGHGVEVVVAFGGADKDGWRGMKFASIDQIAADWQDKKFGNETGSAAYLYHDPEANMGDGGSLERFLAYLRDEYRDSERRFLTLWDHGKSYQEFGNDSNFDMDALSMEEITQAFGNAQPGRFDLIGFDACLMASVEVAKVIEPHADYMLASAELEPGHGWLWSDVILHYAVEQTVVDAGRLMVDSFVGLHKPDGKTLSLLDLSEYGQLVAALDPVVAAYGEYLFSNQRYVDSLIDGVDRVLPYGKSERGDSRTSIDLRHFAQLLAEDAPDAAVRASLDALLDAIDRFVVYANHDGSRPNSSGIAVDAPKNTDRRYDANKVSDAWRDFQSAYAAYRNGDTAAPTVVASDDNADPSTLQFAPDVAGQVEYVDGIAVTFEDENLASVSAIYGYVQPFIYEDGTVDEYFMTVAEVEAYPTETAGEYFAPAWDRWWFTVEYDSQEQTAWIPASFAGRYELGGQDYTEYTAEIDYHQAGRDYGDNEEPYDLGVMTLVVDSSGAIVDHYIQTYGYVFYGPDDEEGTLQFDRATFRLSPGDAVRFWQYGYHLAADPFDEWFETGEFVTFVQEPVFGYELLEFADEDGELVVYEYALWAEDISGNGVLHGPVPVR